MKVYLNSIQGIPDAITSMFMSKRTWTRDKELEIRRVCNRVLDCTGRFQIGPFSKDPDVIQYNEWLEKLYKWGRQHITMLKFIDLSFTVEGLHRGGQDDWDSHAKRFDNRIIRSSTRLAKFSNEMSDYYKDKIIPTDEMAEFLDIDLPDRIIAQDGQYYVKTVNGYVREDLKEDKDVLRGLYMLSIPSNFIYKVNLAEFAHVVKERNANGHANPEVKQLCEESVKLLTAAQPMFTRELMLAIKN